MTLDLYPPGCTIVGVDISERMIEKAKKMALKISSNNIYIQF